jgi:prepilin peptidase CpaA
MLPRNPAMTMHQMLIWLPLLGLLAWAAIQDLRARRIANWLTYLLALSGLAVSFVPLHPVTPLQSLLGLAAGFGLAFVLFGLGAVGGADVKLLAGVGAWIGLWPVFLVFIVEAVLGLVIVLTQAVCQGRLRTLTRNSTVLMLNLVHIGDLGVDHVTQTGQSCRSVDRPLPYAVPVLLATAAVLVLRMALFGGEL